MGWSVIRNQPIIMLWPKSPVAPPSWGSVVVVPHDPEGWDRIQLYGWYISC